MKDYKFILPILFFLISVFINNAFSQNPLITDQYTADPTARVFEGKIYLYPSHDILGKLGQGRPNWFCMEDYHVFSSENFTDWIDHGVIVSQETVPWVNPNAYSMWAPDCIYRNGKYYFYFPAPAKDTTYGRGFSIGVAISNKPYGPFIPEPKPIKGALGIDPNILIDKDGQAYIYYAGRGGITGAKLKDNMLELASEPKAMDGLPNGFKEGPFMFERKGKYYLTFPYVKDSTESLAYCMGDSPMGPFKYIGLFMDKSPTGCWTNHQSIVEYKGQWYLFYHHNDLSPQFDKNRSVRADSLYFNDDGTMKKVIPTLRGIGITDASKKIQIDRYSLKSDYGASIGFLDSLKRFDGWKTIFADANAWVQFNGVDYGNKKFTSVNIKTTSTTGGIIEIHLDKVDGSLLAKIEIGKTTDWEIIKSKLTGIPSGIHNLVVTLNGKNNVEIDWICFE